MAPHGLPVLPSARPRSPRRRVLLALGAALAIPAAPFSSAGPAAQPPAEVPAKGGASRLGTLDGRIVAAITTVAAAHPHLVGLSVGLLQDGVTHVHHHGTVERGRQRPPTSRTVYAIASITKTFTGTLLAQAAVAGRVSLDDDVRTYLDGDFPNLQFEGQPVRLFHLLNHRSGLPTELDTPDHLRQVVLTAPPGQKFSYSNAAARLLGRVLERVEGTSYEELVRRRIATPLGMKDTALTVTPDTRRRLATGYDESGREVADAAERLQAAGGLRSSLADMLAYARWHMEERDAAVRLSHQPTFVQGNYSVGLNWQVQQGAGRRLIWQEGTVPGFTSYCIVEPELGLALVILSNEADPTSSRALSGLANEILSAADDRAVKLP
jgi:CubicO group peptidase (beta-lactamase class C family)